MKPRLFTLTPTTPQKWHCPLCGMTYDSPIPLQHAPNHNCHSTGRPMRNRKMELAPDV